MKTVNDLKENIVTLQREMDVDSKVDGRDERAYAKARRRLTVNRKKITHIKFCIRYIETGPAEDFLKAEVRRLENRIKEFMRLYTPLNPEEHIKSMITAHRKAYEKEMGIPKIRKQLSVLHYLIKD